MYRRKEKWERQRLRSLINAKERAESAIRDASDAEIYQDAAGFRASYNGEFIVVTDVGAEAHDDIADEFIQVRPSDAEHVARILVGVSKLAGGES